MHALAQTNLQLYNQAIGEGWEETETLLHGYSQKTSKRSKTSQTATC